MRKQQTYQWRSLTVGTCYYPEQWDEALWRSDLCRMREAGIRCIRIGEFAWSKVEPEEGKFTFDFFSRFLDLAEELGMKVIFGTPTATPPAWLTEQYPEVLNCRQDGVPYRHGMRRHYNYNSPVYRLLSARIVEAFTSHYAPHPAVVGWQIDNEINCETGDFYSESDTDAFRLFLQEKYGTLDALNRAWGTVFWNQTYTAWEEIYVPRTTIHDSTNPHQVLDYIRFVSDSAVRFCKMQSDIVRKHCKPGDFITTNGLFGHLDNHRMMDEALDVYTYDSYPNFAFCMKEDPLHATNLNDRRWSQHLTEVRSVCPHFGIMEQQSGAMGWNTRMESPAPKPGQLTLWAMQSVAHGADYVSFFRWRTSVMGTEMYWHGILDYDNRDNRKLREVQAFAHRLEAIQDMAGAEYEAPFALVKDYDNDWDAELDAWHRRLTWQSEEEIFIAAQLAHTPMDILYLLDSTEASELLHYPVLFYPHGLILTEAHAALLRDYVAQGGTLVVAARTGQKDATGQCVMAPMPGLLAEATHTDVTEGTFVGPADGSVTMDWAGRELDTGVCNEVLALTGPEARVLARYTGNYYAGEPALVERTLGKGKILHFGGALTRGTARTFLDYLHLSEPWGDVLTIPADCELCVRRKGETRLFFVLNYAATSQTVTLRTPLTDAETGEGVEGTVTLKPYEVKIFRN
ncbi:MAG: beta-galactosidase [Clostridiales bacterium]|nr:beta-galactosidase [Clostridiales bacterium]